MSTAGTSPIPTILRIGAFGPSRYVTMRWAAFTSAGASGRELAVPLTPRVEVLNALPCSVLGCSPSIERAVSSACVACANSVPVAIACGMIRTSPTSAFDERMMTAVYCE